MQCIQNGIASFGGSLLCVPRNNTQRAKLRYFKQRHGIAPFRSTSATSSAAKLHCHRIIPPWRSDGLHKGIIDWKTVRQEANSFNRLKSFKDFFPNQLHLRPFTAIVSSSQPHNTLDMRCRTIHSDRCRSGTKSLGQSSILCAYL